MAYTRGDSKQIIVGAAALFVSADEAFDTATLPDFVSGTSYSETLSSDASVRNVGFTSNGLEMQFQPDFGEVQVDQLLDVAKLFKQGMKVNLNTSFAEASLENLLVAIAAPASDYTANPMTSPTEAGVGGATAKTLNLSSGKLGDVPVERGLVAVGPGTGDATVAVERIYVAYRALSIESVTIGAKRDSASMFEVSFRLLPDGSGNYGKIVDRTVG